MLINKNVKYNQYGCNLNFIELEKIKVHNELKFFAYVKYFCNQFMEMEFYKGLDLISTYPDGRLLNTIKESIKVLENNKNLVIYPENSNNGYFKALEMFHPGISLFLEQCLKKNINAKVYVSYLKKEERKYIIDKPIYIKELLDMHLSREELASYLCDKCNNLINIEISN